MNNIQIDLNGNGNVIGFGQGSGIALFPDSVSMSPRSENLIYLFDPLYYQGYTYMGDLLDKKFQNYIASLNNIFNSYPNIIPGNKYVISRGHINDKTDDPNNLNRKGDKNGTFFSYIKSNDNSDIVYRPIAKDWINSLVKERRLALLRLVDPFTNTFRMFEENKSKTFSFFIKLKSPVQHKTSKDKIIREKKGIFLNTKYFTIGYRSPYYRRRNFPGSFNWVVNFKYKFEPFSFVISLQDSSRNHTFMTDYEFEFNKTYHISISIACGNRSGPFNLIPTTAKVYINGEIVPTAKLDFNPLIKGNGSYPDGLGSRKNKSRNEYSPVQPGFRKINASIYGSSTIHNFNVKIREDYGPPNDLYFGKSNFGLRNSPYRSVLAEEGGAESYTKRFLNNIDVGVMHIYNAVLSDQEVLKIYKDFSNRY